MVEALQVDDKTLRMGVVLREAQVLDETHWITLAKSAGLRFEKGPREVFTQDVSLKAFRDLFLLDLKTLLPGKSAAELERSLVAPVRIYGNEIQYLLKTHQPDVARLCHELISRGLITEGQLEKALDEADKRALNVYDVLVARGLVTPEILERAVQDRTSTIALDNRLLFAGDILTFNNLVTAEDFARALESKVATHAPLATALAQLKILTQDELFAALNKGLELPRADLITMDLSPQLIEEFPSDFIRRQLFIPTAYGERVVEIATADPFNFSLADTLSLLTGKRTSAVYCSHKDLLAKFELHLPATDTKPRPLVALPPAAPRKPLPIPTPRAMTSQITPEAAARVDGAGERRSMVREEPYVDNLSAVQFVSQMIDTAVGAKATDIHIEPQEAGVRVRYRIDGQLHKVMEVSPDLLLSIVSRLKVLAGMNVTERRRPQDGHFSFSSSAGDYDFRVSTLPSFHGEKLVLRVLDSTRLMTGLDEIGLDSAQIALLQRQLQNPHGLVLVTGPTGSGKTSTLYASLSTINREDTNIITIEDPIEYQLAGITQVQVDAATDLTFANGLRSALRQDPDVIMVGEIRDVETAHVAIRAALTGHQVFATLHTNTAIGAIVALIHMDIERYLIASAVSTIIAQRLVRKICTNCRQQYTASRAMLGELGFPDGASQRFWKGEGCDQCFGTGYRGRTGLFEVVDVNEELRRAILDKTPEHELAEIAHRFSKTLKQSGTNKVLEGVTTPEEVIKVVALR